MEVTTPGGSGTSTPAISILSSSTGSNTTSSSNKSLQLNVYGVDEAGPEITTHLTRYLRFSKNAVEVKVEN